MEIVKGTTTDEKEQIKALTAKRSWKELVNKGNVEISECFLLAPAEEGEDRTSAAVKIAGKYYTGVSESVVKTVNQLIDWANKRPPEEDVRFEVEFEKSAGRYGKIELNLI